MQRGTLATSVESRVDGISRVYHVSRPSKATSSRLDLVAGLTDDNVAERLMFADLIGVAEMREASLSYMCESPARGVAG
jgi:hypothetical protein